MGIYSELQVEIAGVLEEPNDLIMRTDKEMNPVEMLEKVEQFNEQLNADNGVTALLDFLYDNNDRITTNDEIGQYKYRLYYGPDSIQFSVVDTKYDECHSRPLNKWTSEYATRITERKTSAN